MIGIKEAQICVLITAGAPCARSVGTSTEFEKRQVSWSNMTPSQLLRNDV